MYAWHNDSQDFAPFYFILLQFVRILEKCTGQKMSVSFSFTAFFQNRFSYSKYLVSYHSDTNENACKVFSAVIQNEKNWKMSNISVKLSNITFHDRMYETNAIAKPL
jgi:hypothetical protein